MVRLRRRDGGFVGSLALHACFAHGGFVAPELGFCLFLELRRTGLGAFYFLIAFVEHPEEWREEQALKDGDKDQEEHDQERHEAQIGNDLEGAFGGGSGLRKGAPSHREAKGERLPRPIEPHRSQASPECRARNRSVLDFFAQPASPAWAA
jgi:hypothetical protein